jgi:hypothetical protein
MSRADQEDDFTQKFDTAPTPQVSVSSIPEINVGSDSLDEDLNFFKSLAEDA